MKFKHTFNVFVDNFSVTYKQLLYRLIIGIIASVICILGIYPIIKNDLLHSPELSSLTAGVKSFLSSLLKGEVENLGDISLKVQDAYKEFMVLVNTKTSRLVLSGLLILIVHLVSSWFTGLGNYATAAVVNDKMALRAESPFLGTLIRNLKEAAIYNAMYVPLSILYDLAVAAAMFFLVSSILSGGWMLLGIFLFAAVIVFAVALKLTFTSDWLPAIIRGKMGPGKSFVYTFNRTNKNTLNVLSNFTVLVILIFGFNVAALLLTFGVGLLLTIPSSYVILVTFELVNYYEREEIKYFLDKNTIIKPAKEHTPTREEFFRGDSD